jgi:hypothetical protein
MGGYGTVFLILIVVIAIVVWLEWIIGKAIGKSVSKGTGLVLGIILICLGFSVLAGIAIIIYSNKNTTTVNINANVTTNMRQNISSSSDTRECPFCAELIKKKATVCRFCGKAV